MNTTTVTGKFSAVKQASRAIDKLLESCVPSDHVRTFVLKSRRATDAGSDCKRSSHGARKSATGAPDGLMGAIGFDVKPARKDGMSITAFRRSLDRALSHIGDDERRGPQRPAGILVTVETSDRVSRLLAIRVLREHGARVEQRSAGPLQDAQPVAISTVFDTLQTTEKSSEAALLRPKLDSRRYRKSGDRNSAGLNSR